MMQNRMRLAPSKLALIDVFGGGFIVRCLYPTIKYWFNVRDYVNDRLFGAVLRALGKCM